MRRRALGGFLAVLLALAACQSGESEPPTTATTSPPTTAATTTTGTTTPTTAVATTTTRRPGPNEVVIGDDQEPPTLNPLAPGGDNWIVSRIGQAIFAGLTEVDGDTGAIIPDLAVELPTVANGGVTVGPDGTTRVTFRIRQEAVWENGTPVTGDDVAFTYRAIMDAGSLGLDRTPYEAITGVAAEGKSVTFTFAAPTLAFETMFLVILPRHQVEGTDLTTDWNDRPWLSAGPFRFESWDKGRQLTLVRNERYWKTDPATGEPLPYLDRVVFRFIPETEELLDAFANREIDVVMPPPGLAGSLRPLQGAQVISGPGRIWEHLAFQFGENNPNLGSLNAHLDFRRAVAYLIDRESIAAQGFWESEQPLDSILALHGLPSDHPWAQYGSDPDRARELLDGLCADLGRDCLVEPPTVVYSTTGNADERPAIGRLIAEMLAAAAIRATVDPKDSAIFFGAGYLDGGGWDLAGWAWMATPGPAGVLQTLSLYDPELPPPEGENYSRWGTPAVSGEISYLDQGPSRVRDAYTARYALLLDEMRTTADHDRFAALAREAENILADQVVFIPLLTRATLSAVWADEIAGYGYSTWLDTWDVETWRRADG
jgi:peptide/nickel transport system substrate-binding protein